MKIEVHVPHLLRRKLQSLLHILDKPNLLDNKPAETNLTYLK